MPLAVPPGIAGMEPSLAVAYSSSAGDGPLGVGFALQGLSAITRCPSNLAQDQAIRPVRYDEADHLCLDGARLVQIASASDFDGSGTAEYRTFPDSFTKIVAHYPAGSDRKLGPQSFEVFTKSGRIALYGSTTDSRAMAKNMVVASWWMSEEHDRRGNAIDYHYLNDVDPADGHTLEILPSHIRYTRHDPDPPARSVELEYQQVSDELAHVSWSGGMRLRRSRLLHKVKMMAPSGGPVRTYVLDYTGGAATGRSLLTSLSECADDGTGACEPPTRFAWSSHGSDITRKVTKLLSPAAYQEGGPHFPPLWLLADVNGDGLEDLVISLPNKDDHTINEWWVSLNGGGWFGTPSVWIKFPYPEGDGQRNWTSTPIDVDQDGLTDILLDHPNLSNSQWPRYRWLRAKPDFTFELMDTAVVHPARVDWEHAPPDPPVLGATRSMRTDSCGWAT